MIGTRERGMLCVCRGIREREREVDVEVLSVWSTFLGRLVIQNNSFSLSGLSLSVKGVKGEKKKG